MHLTGKERDSESGLDNFGARYDSSQYGRFMTPDWSAKPMGVPYAQLGDPQTLNLYAYVRNNPIGSADPDGHNGLLESFLNFLTGADEPPSPPPPPPPGEMMEFSAQNKKDCQCGTNGQYKSANQAATSALKKIFPKSEEQHAEYGGRIYRNANGTYSYTTPVTQEKATEVDVDAGGKEGSRIPDGTTNAGIYHTHETVPGYDPDQFSATDGQHAVGEHVPNYIQTPGGLIHEIDGTNATSYRTAPQYTWRVDGPIP